MVAQCLRQEAVHNGGVVVAAKVGRHQRLLSVGEDSLQIPGCRSLEGVVDHVAARGLAHAGHEIHDRDQRTLCYVWLL